MAYYKNGFKRYLPERFISKYKPKIIDDIMRKSDIIGKVVGINLKNINLGHDEDLYRFTKAFLQIKDEEYEKVFIENQDKLDFKTITKIEEALGLKVVTGQSYRMENISFVIRTISKILNHSLESREVLIICDNKEKMKELIERISKDIKFITALGCEEFNDEIHEYILDKTGLSVFYPKNIDRILKNYDIIIIFQDNLSLDFSKVRKNALVFNFGKNNNYYNKKEIAIIDDFVYDINDLEIDNKFLPNKISTSLFEGIDNGANKNVKYLFLESKYYTIKEYADLYGIIKGKF